MNLAGLLSIVIIGFLIFGLTLSAGDHENRIKALENVDPEGTVTIVVPQDLRKLPCVPMQYLLSNRRISKLHSYSKDLKICPSR